MYICQINADGYEYPDSYGLFPTEADAIAFESVYREEMETDDETLTVRAVRLLDPSDLLALRKS